MAMPSSDRAHTIIVKVVPRSKKQGVEMVARDRYVARVAAPPTDGKANAALVALLAEHFGIAKSCVHIRRGHTSRHKVCEIIRG